MDANISCKCKDCKQAFTTTSKEANWLFNKGLELYKRCASCRLSRKEKDSKKKGE